MRNLIEYSLCLSVTFFAVVMFPGVSYAQSGGETGGTRYKAVKGWVINQYTRSESGGETPSCSAVFFKDRLNAIRVERFRDGYLFGMNGLSRKLQGSRYPLAFRFDGERSTRSGDEAGFVRDAAYPDDDWLSHFHPASQKKSGAIKKIAAKNAITFSFSNPGNRTGNDQVTMTFKLKGSAAALRALDECYRIASSGGNLTANKEYDCPDDGPRMPGSKVCRGRAVNYLDIVEGEQPQLPDGCEWVVNEAAMPGGDYLFYLASKCGSHITKLKFSAGARFAEVTIAQSAMSNGKPGGRIITVGTVDKSDPQKRILFYARNAMVNKSEARKCQVRMAGGRSPADALVVDVRKREAAKVPSDAPRSACGPFGFDGENNSYWRLFGSNSWFFNLGQDAYIDIDPRSLTVVTSDGNDGWMTVE